MANLTLFAASSDDLDGAWRACLDGMAALYAADAV
jgi:hypothetical protein